MASPSRYPRRRTSRSAGRIAGLALLAACAATPAYADSLTAARAVTPAGVEVCDFAVAHAAGGGRTALVYLSGSNCAAPRAVAARLGLGRNLGPAARLERHGEIYGRPRVAVGAGGSAVAAWVARGRRAGRDELRVAIASPGRRFAAARTLAQRRTRRGLYPEIALSGIVAGRDGRAVVSWTVGPRPRSVLRAAVRMRGARFGAPQTLGPIWLAGIDSRPSQTLSASPSGIVVAAWTPTERHAAAAATLPVGRRTFGAARRVSGADDAEQVRAADGAGGAGVSWQAPSADGGQVIMRLARLRRDARLAAPSTIGVSDTVGGRLQADGPLVSFTSRSPFAAWRAYRDISEAGDGRFDMSSVQASIGRSPGVGGVTTVSSAGAQTGVPAVAALSDRGLLAWSETVPTGGARLRLSVNRSGHWAPARTFSQVSGAVQIAAGRRNAVIAWQSFSPSDRRVRLAVYAR
ncbi:MAG: hypothetical protein WKF48_00235 [Solirubrobacteraceae bacterium]